MTPEQLNLLQWTEGLMYRLGLICSDSSPFRVALLMHLFPCCQHCTHRDDQCDPPCDFEGHCQPCKRCAAEEDFIRELLPVIEKHFARKRSGPVVLLTPDSEEWPSWAQITP